MLEQVDLKDTGKKLASQFSTGMKQRLGIAIAATLFAAMLAGGLIWFNRWEGRKKDD